MKAHSDEVSGKEDEEHIEDILRWLEEDNYHY
jgi:hypothetical protein